MLMSKQYDYKALIDAYIQIFGHGRYNKEFKTYYTELVSKLSQLMQVTMGEESVNLPHLTDEDESVLRELFDSTSRAISRPGIIAQWLEGGPEATLFYNLKKYTPADHLRVSYRKALEVEKESKEKYRTLLEDIFTLLYPAAITKRFTSTDLLALGFDDSQEPEWYD